MRAEADVDNSRLSYALGIVEHILDAVYNLCIGALEAHEHEVGIGSHSVVRCALVAARGNARYVGGMEATSQVIFGSSYLGCGFVFSSIAETFGSIASAVLIPYALDASVALVGIEKVYMVVLESVVHDTDDYAFAGVGTVILCHLVTFVYAQQFAGVVHQQFGLSTYRNRNNLIEIGNRFDGRQGHVGSDESLADA